MQCMAQLGRPQGSANCSLGRSPKNMSTGQNSINAVAAHGTQQGFMYISYCSTGQTWLLLQTDSLFVWLWLWLSKTGTDSSILCLPCRRGRPCHRAV